MWQILGHLGEFINQNNFSPAPAAFHPAPPGAKLGLTEGIHPRFTTQTNDYSHKG